MVGNLSSLTLLVPPLIMWASPSTIVLVPLHLRLTPVFVLLFVLPAVSRGGGSISPETSLSNAADAGPEASGPRCGYACAALSNPRLAWQEGFVCLFGVVVVGVAVSVILAVAVVVCECFYFCFHFVCAIACVCSCGFVCGCVCGCSSRVNVPFFL